MEEIRIIEGAEKERTEQRLRDMLQPTKETEETTNLHLTKDEFEARMLKEPDGVQLLELLSSGEGNVCQRMGLTNGYIKDGKVYIDVPGWNNLLAHLRIVNSV